MNERVALGVAEASGGTGGDGEHQRNLSKSILYQILRTNGSLSQWDV